MTAHYGDKAYRLILPRFIPLVSLQGERAKLKSKRSRQKHFVADNNRERLNNDEALKEIGMPKGGHGKERYLSRRAVLMFNSALTHKKQHGVVHF
jgi:hypothetical protein